MRQKAWWLLVTIGVCLLTGLTSVQAAPLRVANTVLTIAAAPWPLVVNQGARITVVATNPSGENADNVVVTAGIPNNMGITNVTTTQGQISVYNSAVTVHVGTLGSGQTMQVYIDVIVVDAYPSDAPFNLCAGMTYINGTARLSCLPNQPAGTYPGKPPATLSPNGRRPINNPNRPPEYLPVSGVPIDLLGPIALLSGTALIGLGWLRRRIR
jgi:hypothetical protein